MDKKSAAIYNFRKWCREQKITQAEAAKKLGVSSVFIYYMLGGHRGISQDMAMKIELLTKGEVKAVDLRPQDKTLKKWREK